MLTFSVRRLFFNIDGRSLTLGVLAKCSNTEKSSVYAFSGFSIT